jgi:ketosteroid isomerase-like protein
MVSTQGMRRRSMLTACVASASLLSISAADHRHDVLAAEQKWLAAYNQRDAHTIERIESDDFRIVLGDGRIQTKTDQLQAIRRPLPSGATFSIRTEGTAEIRLYGDVAILTGIVVERGAFPDEKGQTTPFALRSRYTDVWVFRKGTWQVVSSHQSNLEETK